MMVAHRTTRCSTAIPWPGRVEDVVVGMADHNGEQTGNLARPSVILSKPSFPRRNDYCPICSSGLQSIAVAANQIAMGCGSRHAGGGESISRRAGAGASVTGNPTLLAEKPDIYMAMGNTAEVVARRYNITREMQDEYALRVSNVTLRL